MDVMQKWINSPFSSVDEFFISDKLSVEQDPEQWSHAIFTDIFQVTNELLDRMENSLSIVEGRETGEVQ